MEQAKVKFSIDTITEDTADTLEHLRQVAKIRGLNEWDRILYKITHLDDESFGALLAFIEAEPNLQGFKLDNNSFEREILYACVDLIFEAAIPLHRLVENQVFYCRHCKSWWHYGHWKEEARRYPHNVCKECKDKIAKEEEAANPWIDHKGKDKRGWE